MSVRLFTQTRGTLVATASIAVPAADSAAQDVRAFVEVRDTGGDVVFDADYDVIFAAHARLI